jgi:hypothetical protein
MRTSHIVLEVPEVVQFTSETQEVFPMASDPPCPESEADGPPGAEADDLLEITLEDLEEAASSSEVSSALDLDWEDLEQTPPSDDALLPALEEADAAVAGSPLPWVEVSAVCGSQKKPFSVRFQEQTPGEYRLVAATAAGGKGDAPAPGTEANLSHLEGRFSTAGYRGCPICAAPGLIQCDRCETVMCGGALVEEKSGVYCICPHCGGKGLVDTPKQVTVRGQTGGIKGGKGGKGSGRY